MRQVAKRGILTAVATGSVLASTAGYAYAAGSEAQGSAANSPGVGSGNSVQAPVDIPVNACGNTVNVIGLLNPAYGNQCGNVSTGHGGPAAGGSTAGRPSGGSAGVPSGTSAGVPSGKAAGDDHPGGASASGGSHGSPGVGSGNTVSIPVHAPVNACGNTVDVVGVGNPAFGNQCGSHAAPTPPSTPVDDCTPCAETPPPTPPTGQQTPPQPGTGRSGESVGQAPAVPAQTVLASTGVSGLGVVAPAGVALLLGGGVLYRRSRAGAR
ncbi:chaplin [Kitasatospora sp. NPDC059571]|uniref:chaplin n=1 Tax=Kitasatospora sp. NPDC059571 TaxID=3346871 RepID=UPI0036902EC4